MISLGGFIGGIAMVIFFYFQGFWAVLVAVLALGISVSLSIAARNVYVINQKISKEIGRGQVMGIFLTWDKLGQTMGPLILGLLFVSVGIEQSIAFLGVAYLLATLIFVLGATQEK